MERKAKIISVALFAPTGILNYKDVAMVQPHDSNGPALRFETKDGEIIRTTLPYTITTKGETL